MSNKFNWYLKCALWTIPVAGAALFSNDVNADETLRMSGFGSIVGGTVLDGDGYFARMPEGAGQYVDGIEFKTASLVGVQAVYQMKSNLSVTGQ